MTWTLPTTDAAQIMAAVDAKMLSTRVTPQASADFPSVAQQRSDALQRLITNGGANIDVELIVHVRGDGNTLDDGTPITNHEVAKLIDGAYLRALIHDINGKPIDATHRRRLPSIRQKRVVKERYRTCIDCGRHELLTYDHNPDYDTTKRTMVDELETRCWPCHRKRHNN